MRPLQAVAADVVWPALFLEKRLLSIWVISIGLIVEWLVLWLGGFGLSWKRAVVVDLVMNAASTIVGIVLIPLAGLVWELFPGVLLDKTLSLGTFNPITWTATLVLAVVLTTAIEAVVVRWGFKIALGWRRLWTLAAANLVSVSLAFGTILVHPPHS
jgi:hypothetical protein